MSGGKVVQGLQAVEAGGAVEAAPDAFGGAFFQQERAVFVVPYQPVERQGFDFCRRFFARQFGSTALGFGLADVAHGAGGAGGVAAFAYGRAQVHQALRVGRHVGVFGRQQAFGQCPEGVLELFVLRVAVLGEDAAEYAFDVAVEYGFAFEEGKGGNGGGGAAADSAQLFQFGAFGRELSAEVGHDLFGGFVQVARPAVVAQALPECEYVVFGCGGEGGYGGKGGEEARVVAGHGGDLGLLEHDFRQPDAVGVAAVPGQVVAAVLFLPVYQAVGKGGGEAV